MVCGEKRCRWARFGHWTNTTRTDYQHQDAQEQRRRAHIPPGLPKRAKHGVIFLGKASSRGQLGKFFHLLREGAQARACRYVLLMFGCNILHMNTNSVLSEPRYV